jgi:hypothetical protein
MMLRNRSETMYPSDGEAAEDSPVLSRVQIQSERNSTLRNGNLQARALRNRGCAVTPKHIQQIQFSAIFRFQTHV